VERRSSAAALCLLRALGLAESLLQNLRNLPCDRAAMASGPLLERRCAGVRGRWVVVILVLLVMAAEDLTAGQPAVTDEVLGVRVGPKIVEVTVPASGAVRTVSLTKYSGQEVVIVVRGQFVYSQRPGFPLGRQDAKYRWGSRHPDKVCLPCSDPSREDVSFVIDGKYREPTKEDFASHTYVYLYRVSDSGTIWFQIRDDNYTDNMGELQVTILEKM
jgi:hypothetical protein